jgi:hypothetical protein
MAKAVRVATDPSLVPTPDRVIDVGVSMRTPRRMPPKARSIELSAPDAVRHKIVVVGGAPPLEEHQCKLCGSRINAAVARYVNWTTGEHWHLVCGE